ncbi:MAG: YdeI/OmpD-associated family protein [Gemmobacter sp.]
MARAAEDAPVLTAQSRTDLRDLLLAHHQQRGPVRLASFKRPLSDDLACDVQIEERLCRGWIDSVTSAMDADRSMILIAPRSLKSAWSAVNKAHVARAIALGAMTPAGLAKIEKARPGGPWVFLHDVDALIDPPDLTAALGVAGVAAFWAAMPPLARRGTLEWIKTARRPRPARPGSPLWWRARRTGGGRRSVPAANVQMLTNPEFLAPSP